MAGLFTAILSVLSILTIPMPSGVPITLQTFAVALCGYVLGCKMGTASMAVYILLGFVGLPVFSGMKSGPAVIFGYTGGFLWGFLFLVLLCGWGMRRKHMIVKVLFSLSGIAICHLFGVIQYSIVSGNSVLNAFLLVSLPYLLKDVLSVAGAYFVAVAVRRALRVGTIIAV